MEEVYVVVIADRPPMVYKTEEDAVKFIMMTLARAGGSQILIGFIKTQVYEGERE